MGGGNLGYAASDRQQGTTCVLGKAWPDGSKDTEQRTGWLGAVPVGFQASRLEGLGVTVGIQKEVQTPEGKTTELWKLGDGDVRQMRVA